MKFGEALEAVKSGAKIARSGWNGANQFVIKAGGYSVDEARPGSDYERAGITGTFTIAPHLDLKNAQGVMQPGWVPSQGDLFADDWYVVGSDAQHMPPHQMRVVEERDQLLDRLIKLAAFINGNGTVFANLSDDEKARLLEQAKHMDAYGSVLERRIAAFPVQ